MLQNRPIQSVEEEVRIPHLESAVDAYFSADVETDGPIPGPYSILSIALVYAGSFDGKVFQRPRKYDVKIYKELKPISDEFEIEALRINGLDRSRLSIEGESPQTAMTELGEWVKHVAGDAKPVLVAYPLSFDWAWLYWYFIRFSKNGSPFGYSRCFDIKTALAVKSAIPISEAGRSRLQQPLRSQHQHKHSRLLTCYSALLYLLAIFKLNKTVTQDNVLEMILLSPTQRLEWLKAQSSFLSAHAAIDALTAQYELFLATTNVHEAALVESFMDKNKAKLYMTAAYKFGDLMYETLQVVGEDSQFYRLLVV